MLLNDYVPDVSQAVLAFLFAGAVAWMLVPSTESLARRIGAIDYPDERSLHDAPTPRLGGIAVLGAVIAGGIIFLPWVAETRAILAGAALIALVGVVDDVYDLNPAMKLLGQTAAAVIPVTAGVSVHDFTVPFLGRIEPGVIEFPWGGSVNAGDIFTTLGIVAIVNLINFSDGVDGLAAGVCLITATTLVVIALSKDRYAAAVLAAITAGAALGFLRHGFPPASSFMGDTGSNLLGYLLAIIAVQGSLKTNAVLALALPLVVLAVPILDGSFVIAKRLKYRQPVYRADRWHFHHRMANIGFSQRRTLLYLYGWTLALALVALALRVIPYHDDHNHLDPFWAAVIGLILLGALAASIYVVYVLEILKLRRFRLRQLFGRPSAPAPVAAEIDAAVERELETGSFDAVVPGTSEVAHVDPDTGEMEALRTEVPEPPAELEERPAEGRASDA